MKIHFGKSDALKIIMNKVECLVHNKKTPQEYQELDWIEAGNGVAAYINLGFCFDQKGKYYLQQYFFDGTKTYPFGAVGNGTADNHIRCCLTSPYGSNAVVAYGSTGTAFNSCQTGYVVNCMNNIQVDMTGNNIIISNFTTEETVKGTTQASYTMTNELYLFAQNYNNNIRYGGRRRIGKFQYWDKNGELICDLIPCIRKVDNKVGMYDVARGVFLTSIGTGDFTPGTKIF